MKLLSKKNLAVCICIYSLFFGAIVIAHPLITHAQPAPAPTPAPTTPPQRVTREYTLLEPLPCIPNTEGITCNTKGYVEKINLYSILGYAYRLFLAVAALLAVVMIMYGGVLYMTTEAFTGKSEAKTVIYNAVIGLFMTLGSFLFLETIDPRITELALDPLPTIGVDRKNILDVATLQKILEDEAARIRSVEQATSQQADTNTRTADNLTQVSLREQNLLRNAQDRLALENAKVNPNPDTVRRLQTEIVTHRQKEVLTRYDGQVVNNYNRYFEEINDVQVPVSQGRLSATPFAPWDPNASLFQDINPTFALSDFSTKRNSLTIPHNAARTELQNGNDVAGVNLINNRIAAVNKLGLVAKDMVDFEKRYEKFAVKVSTQGAAPSTFASTNQKRVGDLIAEIATETSPARLTQIFGPNYANDPMSQFYVDNMKLYQQRLQNILVTYK